MTREYKCLKCGRIGEHQYEGSQNGDFGENGTTEYTENLTCSNKECNSEDQRGGIIDEGNEIHPQEDWSVFEQV